MLASRFIRSTPPWTKSRWAALIGFPRIFFDPRTEYVAQLAGSSARVLCRTTSLMEKSVLCLGVWEEEDSAYLDRTVQPGWTILDLGANVGLHTCRLAAQAGPTGKVFAFEPNPAAISRLRDNVKLNNFKNVQPVACGIAETPGTANLYVNEPGNPSWNSTFVHNPETPKAVATPAVLRTLDDCWQKEVGAGRVDFIKADIEGYEFAALRSGEKMLRSCRPIILSEYCQYYAKLMSYNWGEIHRWFTGIGYGLFSPEGEPIPASAQHHPRVCFNYVARPN